MHSADASLWGSGGKRQLREAFGVVAKRIQRRRGTHDRDGLLHERMLLRTAATLRPDVPREPVQPPRQLARATRLRLDRTTVQRMHAIRRCHSAGCAVTSILDLPCPSKI